MEERNSFTKEELAIAKSVDLTDVARNLGYTVKRVGSYFTLKEIDSLRIYNRRSWFRWSKEYDKGENGGSQIDFLRVFAGMEVKEAVFWLLDFAGYRRYEEWKPKAAIVEEKTEVERKPFVLPVAASDNRYLYRYLMEERRISKAVIDEFVKAGLIYEERRYHNIVFKGNDKNGNTLFASMRGVFDRNTDSSKMAEVIGVSEAQLRFVTNTQSGMGLMKCGNVVIPFDNTIEKGTDLYNLYNTNLHEKIALEKSKNVVDND